MLKHSSEDEREKNMSESKPEITAFNVWSQTIQALKKELPASLWTSFLFLFLPGVIFSFFLRYYSHAKVSFIRETTDAMLTGAIKTQYETLYLSVSQFTSAYVLCAFLFFLLLTITITKLASFSLRSLDPNSHNTLSVKETLKLSFPKVFIILLVSFLLSSERAFLGPVRLLSLLSLIALPLMISQKKGVMSSLWSALTLAYTRKKRGFGFTVLWILFSTGALLYLYEYAFQLSLAFLKDLPEKSYFFSSMFSYRPNFFPCSLWQSFLEILQFSSYLFLLIFVIHFITVLYKLTEKPLSERK